MSNIVSRIYGMIFLWHALRHFNSFALLGSQSCFENPRLEWIIIGVSQILVGLSLLWKPNFWGLFAGAAVLFMWCSAYPVGRHVGDSAFILLLVGVGVVKLGGSNWVPLATLPSTTGLLLAAFWKIRGGNFSVCDVTNCVLVRYPWTDSVNAFFRHHSTISEALSYFVITVEGCAILIWALLFFPRLHRIRSVLTLLPMGLLAGIGLTGNLDEFPWIMLTAWMLIADPNREAPVPGHRWILYPAALLLYTAALFNLEINLRRIYAKEDDFVFEKSIGILPADRIDKMILFLCAPYWNMYASPILHQQEFGGETSRMAEIRDRIASNNGCGLMLNRWERIYWERIGRGLNNPRETVVATQLKDKYERLDGKPCSMVSTIIRK